MDYEPRSSYDFRKKQETDRAIRMGTTIKQTTNSRKVPYTTEYELSRDIKDKEIIDEINRQNLYSDYGV
jgi:hypothetical protein